MSDSFALGWFLGDALKRVAMLLAIATATVCVAWLLHKFMVRH